MLNRRLLRTPRFWLALASLLAVAAVTWRISALLRPSAGPAPAEALAPVVALIEPAATTTPSPTPGLPAPTEPMPTPIPPTATATKAPPTATASPTPTLTPWPTDTPAPTATATSAATPTPTAPQATIREDVVNVRSGPGTAYPVIARTRRGQVLPIAGVSQDGRWWQVELQGSKGWISGSLAEAGGPLSGVAAVAAEPPPTAVPAAASSAPAAPRPAASGFFGYGIQIDPWGDRGAAIAAVKGLNFDWVKFQLPWKSFEGAPGQRNWPDDIVNDLNGAGLNILASIVKAPNWARASNTDLAVEGPPADPGTYAGFVGEFAARYCGRVQAIEVWNEQNLHYEWGNEPLDAARYMRLLTAAYRAIKGSCPAIVVVSGAPTPTGAPPPWAIRDTTYLEQMYRNGLRGVSDAIGVHPSGYGNPPDVRVEDFQAGNYSRPSHVNDSSFYFRNTMEQYHNIMVKYGDGGKRLWPTEFGWASSGSPVAGYEYAAYNSEQQQGEYIARAYAMMRNWGFVGVAFLWNLNYNQSHPGTELAAFGIMGRPAYSILQGMQR